MGKTDEYHKQREDELLNHFCAYRNQYTYISTRRDRIERQLEAADARSRGMAQTICPFFVRAEPFQLNPPGGYCSAADNEVCRMKCGKGEWDLVDGQLVRI